MNQICASVTYLVNILTCIPHGLHHNRGLAEQEPLPNYMTKVIHVLR